MKRIFALTMIIVLSLMLLACSGNYFDVDIEKPVPIPDDGIIKKTVFDDIRSSSAITIFVGRSGNLEYRWLVFGSQVSDTKDVDLSVELQEASDGIAVTLPDALPFPAMLSIALNEKLSANAAAAYQDGTKVASVSLTGTDATTLNFPVQNLSGVCKIIPQAQQFTEGSDPNRPNSDGSGTEQDNYLTDPVPEGKPLPVEPGVQADKNKSYTCTFSIECTTILNNITELEKDKRELIPWDGVILPPTEVTFYAGESVFDVLQRVCIENNIHMEASWTPIYNSAYIEGIHNLYEFDCGSLSGWMYAVNGWYPNYGCSRYQLTDGEVIQWRFTCDLGNDVGSDLMGG